MEDVYQGIDDPLGWLTKAAAVNCSLWIDLHKLLVDGQPFSFDEHEYQIAPIACNRPRQCARKGAQIGWTTMKMIRTLWGHINNRHPQGTIYYFPTYNDVLRFSKTRFRPFLDDNPDLDTYITSTDSNEIKRIGKSHLLFLGLTASKKIGGSKKSSSQAKSQPADVLRFDEVDEMDRDMMTLAIHRIDHSKCPEEDYMGTPTLPDYGIDDYWQKSSQNIWVIQCPRCNHWFCQEKEFEEHLWLEQKVIVRVNGEPTRCCPKCGRVLPPLQELKRQWIRSFADRPFEGWWISQLNSCRVPVWRITEAFEDPKREITENYNSIIGMPYVEAENRLTQEQILEMCSFYGNETSFNRPCYMGVDQGKHLHVVIVSDQGTMKPRVVHLGVYKDWADLDNLMKKFRVLRCVVDGLPETRNAAAFASKFPGRVFLNYYVEKQKGGYVWDEEKQTVSSGRTASLDDSHQEYNNDGMVLPARSAITKEFAKHMNNVAKKLEEDQVSGSKRYVYVKLRSPDHFRHAANYEKIARSRDESLVFAGVPHD